MSLSLVEKNNFNWGKSFHITFEKNLALILGIIDMGSLLKDNKNEVTLLFEPGQQPKILNYDLARSVRDISLRSYFVSMSESEISFKRLSQSELNFLDNSNEMSLCSFNQSVFNIEIPEIEGWTFYFLNSFGEKIKFNFATLYVNVNIKCKK